MAPLQPVYRTKNPIRALLDYKRRTAIPIARFILRIQDTLPIPIVNLFNRHRYFSHRVHSHRQQRSVHKSGHRDPHLTGGILDADTPIGQIQLQLRQVFL